MTFRTPLLALALAISLPAAAGPDAPATTDAPSAVDEAYLHAASFVKLLSAVGTEAFEITIDVQGRKVVLDGDVDARAKKLAPTAVRAVDGVEQVVDRLTVEKGGAYEEPVKGNVADATLHASARMALIGAIGGDALDLEIATSGGEVIVRGTVDSAAHRREAVEAVRGLDAVKQVRDELVVAE